MVAYLVETKRVLLVENNLVFREALAYALNLEPDFWVIGQVASVVESRNRVADGASVEDRDRTVDSIDAEIIDFVLPDIVVIGLGLSGGKEPALIKRLREAHPEVRVLALIPENNRASHAGSLEASADGVLGKEATFGEIVGTMRCL